MLLSNAAPRVVMRDVESTNIECVGWITPARSHGDIAIVRFKGGRTYLYFGVPRQRVVAMARSNSVGSYFARKIKGRFHYAKLAS